MMPEPPVALMHDKLYTLPSSSSDAHPGRAGLMPLNSFVQAPESHHRYPIPFSTPSQVPVYSKGLPLHFGLPEHILSRIPVH